MTVKYFTGDLFSSSVEVIGHGVNTQGIMGAGVAKAVRSKYPKVYEIYKLRCNMKQLVPGDHLTIYDGFSGVWVANIASQEYLGADAKLELLESGLTNLLDFMEDSGLETLALPRIGAGIGGLEWNDVKELIENISKKYEDIIIEVWSL